MGWLCIYFKQIATKPRTPLRTSPIETTPDKCGTTNLDLKDVNGRDGEQIFKAINDEPQSPKMANTKKGPARK
jgi:hypothetical protein